MENGELGTDCHDQFANWSRNDEVRTRGIATGDKSPSQ